MSPVSGPAEDHQVHGHGQHEPQDSSSSAAPTSTDASFSAPPEAAADVSPPPPPPLPSSVESRLTQQPGGGGRGTDGWSSAAAAVDRKGKKKKISASDDREQAERNEPKDLSSSAAPNIRRCFDLRATRGRRCLSAADSSVESRHTQQPGGGGRGADGWSSAAAASDEQAEKNKERKSDSVGRRTIRAVYHGHAKEEAMSKKLPWDDPRLRKEQVTPVSTRKKSLRSSILGYINNEELNGLLVEERQRFGPPYVSINEFAVTWSLKDDDIWYPLYAEILGDIDPSIKPRKVWDDIRVIRKLRPLRNSEKASARAHYKMIQVTYRKRSLMASPIYERLFIEDAKSKDRLEGFKIPDNLVCPLCGKVMVDPVMVATGQTLDRRCIRAWFDKHGHFCPVTCQPISPIVPRNERARGYLVEWREAELEVEADATSSRP